MIPHTCRNPAVMAPECTTDSDVIATLLYVADMDRPLSLPASSAQAASSTVFDPVMACAHVTDVVVLLAPAEDGPTASNATGTAAPHGTVQVAYGGLARIRTQSGSPTELFPCAAEL